MDDHTHPLRLLAVLVLSITAGIAAVAGHLVSGHDLMTALGSGLVMALVEGTLHAFLTGGNDRPSTDNPPADPEPPTGCSQ